MKNSYNKEYYEKNKDRIKVNWQKYYFENKAIISEKHKGHKLKWRYGITVEEHNRMAEAQKGLCAICECEKPLVVDHNHETNKVRGLLCQDCNKGLGFFEDNVEIVESAINYLSKSKGNQETI